MLKIGLVVLLILMAGRNYAQDEYFVLIQADNSQPFYAHIGDRSFTSSPQGHLIIPQLRDSPYLVMIGFPGQLYPEQAFSLIIKEDQGFQLRNLDERGWGLSDMRTRELKMAEKKDPVAVKGLRGVRKDDAFSRLMAGVVGDTAVMYNTYAMEETMKEPAAGAPSTRVSPPAAAPSPATSGSSASPAIPGNSATSGSPAIPGTSGTSGGSGNSAISDSSRDLRVLPDTNRSRETDHSTDTDHPMDSNGRSANIPADSSNGSNSSRSSHPVDPAAGGLPAGARVATDTARSVLPALPAQTDSITALTPAAPSTTTRTPATRIPAAPPSPAPTTAVPGSATAAPAPATPGPGAAAALHPASVVLKLSERKTPHSLRLAFADHTKGRKADTIIVYIPLDTAGMTHPAPPQNGLSAPAGSINPGSGAATAIPPAGASTTSPGSSVQPAKSGSPATPSRLPFINSDCKNFATDYDIDKLRVKMLESAKDDDRIAIARKAFRTKCVSSRQAKALCEVFTTDAVKFKFLETAYPFVSDDHFRELSELLVDPVYNSRFKAMTGQH